MLQAVIGQLTAIGIAKFYLLFSSERIFAGKEKKRREKFVWFRLGNLLNNISNIIIYRCSTLSRLPQASHVKIDPKIYASLKHFHPQKWLQYDNFLTKLYTRRKIRFENDSYLSITVLIMILISI